MENELKPCPFCGGEAEMYVTPSTLRRDDYTPRCKNPSCCGRVTKKYSRRDTAVMLWNRRAKNGT